MRLCRFDDNRVGVVRGDRVYDITAIAGDQLVPDVPHYEKCPARALRDVRLLSPVRAPGKILAAPVNYKAHIEEMHKSNVSPGHNLADIDKAGLFLKATSSLVGPSQGIAQRFLERRTDFEVELVAVMGEKGRVAGYCLGLDITLRGTEDRSFRKSIDSYTVLGPWLTTADELPDPQNVQLTLRQNGELRQNTNTSDMVWDLSRLIGFAQRFYTLHAGDVFFTGTPAGVGPIRPGDRLLAESPQLGSMEVRVRAHE